MVNPKKYAKLRLRLTRMAGFISPGKIYLTEEPELPDGAVAYSGFQVDDTSTSIHGRPVFIGPRGGLFVSKKSGPFTINHLSKTRGPNDEYMLSQKDCYNLIRAKYKKAKKVKNPRIVLSAQEGLITEGKVRLPVRPTFPADAAKFAGFIVNHPKAYSMHGEPVWEGPLGGLFVVTRSGRSQPINQLVRGEDGQLMNELSHNNRRCLVRASIPAF